MGRCWKYELHKTQWRWVTMLKFFRKQAQSVFLKFQFLSGPFLHLDNWNICLFWKELGFLTVDLEKVVVDSSLPILLDTKEKFKEQKHIFNFLPHFDTIRYRNINFLPYWIRILLHIINEVFIVFNIINVYFNHFMKETLNPITKS